MNKKTIFSIIGLFVLIGCLIFLYFKASKTDGGDESVSGPSSVEKQLYDFMVPSNISAYECDMKAKEMIADEAEKMIGPKLQQYAYDVKLRRCFGLRSGINSSGNQVDEVEDIYAKWPLWACEVHKSGIKCAIRDTNDGQGFNFSDYPPTTGIPPVWYEFKKYLTQ